MQSTAKAANSHSTKRQTIKKTDGYLLYDTIICHRISTRLRDTVEGEEKTINAYSSSVVSSNHLPITSTSSCKSISSLAIMLTAKF